MDQRAEAEQVNEVESSGAARVQYSSSRIKWIARFSRALIVLICLGFILLELYGVLWGGQSLTWTVITELVVIGFALPIYVIVASVWAERLLGELDSAFSEIRLLKGLLPICASCKNVRDDKGYWERIESYVQRNSEAIFSHSLCPDCLKTQFPEYLKAVSRQTSNKPETTF
jgi:hypothetical protein